MPVSLDRSSWNVALTVVFLEILVNWRVFCWHHNANKMDGSKYVSDFLINTDPIGLRINVAPTPYQFRLLR